MSDTIWECDVDEANLWETDPVRAARLAYLRLQCHWHEQVENGIYEGIPEVRSERAPAPLRPRPCRQREVQRDARGGQYQVPHELRRRIAV